MSSDSPPGDLDVTQAFDRSGEHAPPSDAEALEKGTQVGRYLILQALGKGGMGVVYSAYDPELDRKIALKLVRGRGGDHPSATARLVREAQAMAKVVHPNVVTVHEVGTWYGRVFLAMELVEGDDLTHWLAKAPRSWKEVLQVFVAAGEGLAAAHDAGLVHRDFKPDNVLLGKDGRPRVTDFGLVRPADEPGDAVGHSAPISPVVMVTEAGVVMGTPSYMAPEQMEAGTVTPSADQFAFGASLFHALYGVKPFAGESLSELHQAIQARALRPAPPGVKVPARLRRVLARALQPEPSQRFATMGELLTALRRDPVRNAARAAGWLAAAALAFSVLAGFGWRAWADAHRCDQVQRELDGIWDDSVRGELRAGLGPLDAAQSGQWAQMERWFDRYSALWTQERRSACEFSRAGDVDPRLALARDACVERRRSQLRASVEMMRRLKPTDLSLAHRSVGPVSDLHACDIAPQVLPKAENPQQTQLHEAVVLANLLTAVGRRKDAEQESERIARLAEANGEHRLASEAYGALANAIEDTGDDTKVIAAWKKSLLEAEASREDEQVFNALLGLAVAQSYEGYAYDEALWNLDQAAALLERLALPKEQEARWYRTRADVLEQAERPAEALVFAEKALELKRAAGADESEVYEELQVLANVRSDLGDIKGSSVLYQKLLEGQRSTGASADEMRHAELYLGEELVLLGEFKESLPHLALAHDELNIGWHAIDNLHSDAWSARAYAALGDADRVAAALERADHERTGLDRPDSLAEYFLQRARAQLWLGRLADVEADDREVIRLLEPVHEANRSELLEAHMLEAERLRRLGQLAAALAELEGADKGGPRGDAETAQRDTLSLLIRLQRQERIPGAVATLKKALEVIELNEGSSSPSRLTALHALALAERAAGDGAAAQQALGSALEVAKRLPGDRFGLAELQRAQTLNQ